MGKESAHLELGLLKSLEPGILLPFCQIGLVSCGCNVQKKGAFALRVGIAFDLQYSVVSSSDTDFISDVNGNFTLLKPS